jgi:hypothetical protein
MTRTLLGLVGLLALLAPGPPPLAAAAELPRWMTGCWTGSRGAETFTERWVAADASTLIGTSHTVKGGVLSAFEFLRVVLKGAAAVYVAQPNGVPPTEFAATAQTPAEITFENPAHDFPKRVGYRRLDGTHLTAWIDGGPGAKGPRLEFAMTKTACD